MHKRTMQEVADFFDTPMVWDGTGVLFLIDGWQLTTNLKGVIEKPKVNYIIKFEPRREEPCTN